MGGTIGPLVTVNLQVICKFVPLTEIECWMGIIVQLLFGWPAIVGFLAVATVAAWRPSKDLMVAALFWSVPNFFYLFGGNGWIRLVALYLPLSLGLSIFLLEKKLTVLPKLLLCPLYGFYAWLAYAVVSQ